VSERPVATIGFVGIGNMGWPMAANLVRAGFDVAVCDARAGQAHRFAADVGGRPAACVAEAVAGARVLVTMLPTSAHVEEVLGEAEPVLAAGTVVVEMSSGIPSVTRGLAATLADRGIALVDCPVSGGVARAATGELTIMAGGDAAALARVAPVLMAMGSSVHHCGGVGTGQAMKALNNLVSAAGLLVAVEALLIGHQSGLDPHRMVEVLNASTGMNNSTQKKLEPFVLSRAFDSGFGLDLMAKDLGTAMRVAREGGVAAPFSGLCAELWSSAAGLLGSGRDHTEVARFSEALAGFELTSSARPENG
jgi:3-hydroxyisobutyrate dehydrogenase